MTNWCHTQPSCQNLTKAFTLPYLNTVEQNIANIIFTSLKLTGNMLHVKPWAMRTAPELFPENPSSRLLCSYAKLCSTAILSIPGKPYLSVWSVESIASANGAPVMILRVVEAPKVDAWSAKLVVVLTVKCLLQDGEAEQDKSNHFSNSHEKNWY